jgi:IMP dehydrogenase/GMP reductase
MMNSQQKNTKEELFNCCQGMDFAEMMRKMMAQEGGCCDFDCAEMMQKMMTRCGRSGEEKQDTAEPVKEPQGTTQ